jgi:signal transduction histidine kinase
MALRPTTLDDLGLIATIAWFSREFQATYPHMEVVRQIEVEEFEVPSVLKTNIFRILQEAMNNAAKHSEATQIRVGLSLVLGELQLLVGDNGIGFSQTETRTPGIGGGFGLISMRERADLFGGSLIVTSSRSEGTLITARWPLPDESIS